MIDEMSIPPEHGLRLLHWDACLNVRDLGTMSHVTGGEFRHQQQAALVAFFSEQP